MEETPFFFEADGHRLFGVLHAPAGTARETAFVFCHPFGEEKLWAHRVYVAFARELAARGFGVLRFDMVGHGDSGGRFEDASIDAYLADIRHAAARLQASLTGVKAVGFLGLRLGASLAILAAEQCPQASCLILWDPVVDGEKHAQELLLTNLSSQMAAYGRVVTNRAELIEAMKAGGTANIDGYELSHAFFSQIAALRLAEASKRFDGRCLIVQIDRGAAPVRKDLAALQQSYGDAQLLQAVEQPFWKEIKQFYDRADQLFAATLAWEGLGAGVAPVVRTGTS